HLPVPRPRLTPFPYTTLFRSPARGPWPSGASPRQCLADLAQHQRGVQLVVAHELDKLVGGVLLAIAPEVAQESASPRGAEPLLRSEEHTSELQSRGHLVCRLL